MIMNKYTLILLFALFSFKSATAQNIYTTWDETSILKYWKKNGLKQFEGIYYYDMGYEFIDVEKGVGIQLGKDYNAKHLNQVILNKDLSLRAKRAGKVPPDFFLKWLTDNE